MHLKIVATVTLWVVIRGFANSGGSVNLLQAATMEPIGTYRTAAECDKVGRAVLNGLQKGGTDADVLCLPNGVRDPIERQTH